MYIRSSKNSARSRRIVAEGEIQQDVSVDPEATELVFETEDVAELVAEVTGEDVEVVADDESVTFTVGDTDYTVEADGQEEILEASSRALKGKKVVKASRNAAGRRPVSSATRRSAGRTVRKVSR
jgi:uncharacterized protein (AIM24 family)